MSFSDTQSAKRYASIAEVAAAQAKIYAQELQEAPNYAAEAAASAEAAANSSSSASQYASNAATAASSASSSASAAASSAADAAGAAQSAIGQTVRAPQGETLSPMPEAAARQNKYIATDSAGDIALVDRATIPVLDSSGKLPVSTIPAIALTEPFVVSSQTAMLALDAQTGDIAKRTDLGYSFCLAASPASTLSNWIQLTDDVLAQLGLSSGATQVGATSLTGASSTVQAELSKKPDSTNLAASNGAASIGALDDTGSATTVQGALALKVAATTLAGTGAGKGANIVGYKSALAGAVARTIQSKFAEFLSVKDFGAVGDGVTDDTAAITAAITVGKNTNWMVYFPPGDYVISSVINVDLDVKTQLVLMGAGEHTTKIKVSGASQNFLAVTGNYGNYWLDSVTPNGSFTMSNMTVSCWGGVDNSGTAISMNMGSQLGRPNKGIRFTNVSFKSEAGFFAYSVSLRNCAQINFDTCRFFSGNGVQSGIGILGQCDSGQDGGGMFINNCEFFYFLHGIYTKDRFEGIYVTSSAFINCQYGFTSVVGSESGVLITNSEFDCMSEGVHLEGMYDFVITGNCFLAQDADGQIAISVKNGSGFTITGNKIEGTSPTTGTGILLENTDDTLTRASYVGSNSIANCNIAMQITNCSNITFGPWAWKSCTLDTNAGGTNAYIQQGCYEKNTTIVKTLSASTAIWTITIDISDMRLTRTPKFANLVSQSASNMISQYNYSASSNTSVVFVVVLGNGGTIAANPYRFGLSIRQPYFDI